MPAVTVGIVNFVALLQGWVLSKVVTNVGADALDQNIFVSIWHGGVTGILLPFQFGSRRFHLPSFAAGRPQQAK